MPKRKNELFIGTEFLNLEGRSIKHPALIKHYANVNANKLQSNPIPIHGIDIETEHTTGEMMLLGVVTDSGYHYYTRDFTRALFMHVKAALSDGAALAYWNRLDPFVILRALVHELEHHQQERALLRFGKEGGEFDTKAGIWSVDPLVQLEIGGIEFGIKQAIRSSIQFYIINDNNKMKTVWAYDIAQLFPSGLEKEATKRFSWYSKIDDSAHLVNWIDFASDPHYREHIVLKSNKLDAEACRALAYAIQEDFKRAFGSYSRSLISQGALARAAIVATLYNKLAPQHVDEKELKKEVQREVKAIGFMNYYDEIAETKGGAFVKDLYALLTEAYSGGLIEAASYGSTDTAYYADIASAYPAITQYLYDLRGATWTSGTGTPERADKGYTVIRGTVSIPDHVNFHPLTVKHPMYKDTNIRPTGTFKASYTIEERDFLTEEGATFTDETWYKVETKGVYSPLAKATTEFVDLRKKLKAAGDSAEWMAKSSAASVYGITYEATDISEEIEREKNITVQHDNENYYKDMLRDWKGAINLEPWRADIKHRLGDGYYRLFAMWHNPKASETPDTVRETLEQSGLYIESDHPADIIVDIDELYRMPTKTTEKKKIIVKDTMRTGYRGGEFWNPLYATIITSRTRLLMARAARAIERAGGQVIIMMTDSITWKGTRDMLPDNFIREVKTLGYFESPEKVKNVVCLGSGRYGFSMWNKAENDYTTVEAKRRGLNAVDVHDKNGISIGTFNWSKVLEMMKQSDNTTIPITVRTLISPGLVVNSNTYTIKDLGRIVEQTREIQSIVGKTKRDINPEIDDPQKLATEMLRTRPLRLDPAMLGKYEINDQTLPLLRDELMVKTVETQKERTRKNVNKGKKKHYENNKTALRQSKRWKYAKLRSMGYDAEQSKTMKNWSGERIEKETGIKL